MAFRIRTGRKAPPRDTITEEYLVRWLSEYLAERIEIPVEEIDVQESFESYGLDSRLGVQASGALEKLLGTRLSPGLLYEHQSVRAVAAHLSAELGLGIDDR